MKFLELYSWFSSCVYVRRLLCSQVAMADPEYRRSWFPHVWTNLETDPTNWWRNLCSEAYSLTSFHLEITKKCFYTGCSTARPNQNISNLATKHNRFGWLPWNHSPTWLTFLFPPTEHARAKEEQKHPHFTYPHGIILLVKWHAKSCFLLSFPVQPPLLSCRLPLFQDLIVSQLYFYSRYLAAWLLPFMMTS